MSVEGPPTGDDPPFAKDSNGNYVLSEIVIKSLPKKGTRERIAYNRGYAQSWRATEYYTQQAVLDPGTGDLMHPEDLHSWRIQQARYDGYQEMKRSDEQWRKFFKGREELSHGVLTFMSMATLPVDIAALTVGGTLKFTYKGVQFLFKRISAKKVSM